VEDQKLISDVGQAAQGIVFATYNGFPENSFAQKIQAYYNKPIQRWNLEGYETFQFLLEGIKKAPSYTRNGIKEGFSSVKTLKTIAGNFTFDNKGNIQRDVFMKMIDDNAFVPYKQ
jgi:ABC-type branched-subunit amino acid transport system substrate-binding protein